MEESGELPNRNRIFALTGNARSGQIESARESGMDDVIVGRSYFISSTISLTPPALLRLSHTGSMSSSQKFRIPLLKNT